MIIDMFRKFVIKYRISAFVAVIFMMASCSKQNIQGGQQPTAKGLTAQQHIKSAAKSTQYSDRDVFKGVIFMEGQVAQLFPEFSDFAIENLTSDATKIADAQAFQDRIIDQLVATDANYLSNFRTNVGSGDYEKVVQTLDGAANDIVNAIAVIEQQTPADVQNELNDQAQVLASKYSLGTKSTKADYLNAAKKKTEDNNVWVWYISVVVVVVAAVAFWLAIVQNPDNNTFSKEELSSEITLQCTGI